MPLKNVPVFKMKHFKDEINKMKNKRKAKENVQRVIQHYDKMKNGMPQVALDKLGDFLSTEDWVTSSTKPSPYRLYKIMKGHGRTSQRLHFGMWVVVSAMWPNSGVVVKLASVMSKHWGVQFPGTSPWFPSGLSNETIENKWDCRVPKPIETKKDNKSKKGKQVKNVEESQDKENEESDDDDDEESDYEDNEESNDEDNEESGNEDNEEPNEEEDREPEDTEGKGCDNSKTHKKRKKRNADLFNEAEEIEKLSTLKRQKTNSDAIHIDLDDDNEPDLDKLNKMELTVLLLTAKERLKQARERANAESEVNSKLMKRNQYLEAIAQQNTVSDVNKLKDMSSEIKELKRINSKQSQLIEKFKDRIEKQDNDLYNTETKYIGTKVELDNIKLKYNNKEIELMEATSKQADTEAQLSIAQSKQEETETALRETKSQLEDISTRLQGTGVQSSANSNHEDVEAKLKKTVSQLDVAKSKKDHAEATLQATVSQLTQAHDKERILRRQIMSLEDTIRGWQLASQQANHADTRTISMSIHGINTEMADRFNRVENAMVELAKKGQDGFDAITKQLSKKDN
ncbi:hypothetical protein FMUND_7712 [Fusarium mundagurra]|uniref:Uncharacterized protein n=1 Tax=Fusarium mundagurra TaxID=1567541 RepID=A0A8H5YLR9_9HYPO|nr:hypothetical protein FMUND_7712 [Fusarium mundagurra]